MKTLLWFSSTLACLGIACSTLGQTGPFDPENWPATIDSTKAVHYIATDDGFTPPSDSWHATPMTFINGTDDAVADFTIGGHTGKKATGSFLNVADSEFEEWADDEFIDILIQAYGDAALFSAEGTPRDFTFLTGVLPNLAFPVGGQVPVDAKNKRWNWILFRIPNGTRPDGSRFVGSIPADAQGNYQAGGVNGGTIRFESVPNLIVRVVAFGAQGAFGEPADINKFLPAETCEPEPNTNLVGLDLAAGTTNYLVVLNGHDHTVTFASDVGPASDKRNAVIPDGSYLNFGILSNYLGQPCNDPRSMKVCVDFYDDPAFAGMNVRFGPEAYATDAQGGVGFYPAEKRQLLEGTGQWIRRSWTVPAVNLKGVNADEYTAGPRFNSQNGQVAVSRVEMAVLREGTHPLAGQDPLASCVEDPNVCTGLYGNYAELDLAKGIEDGLSVGTSSGDQEMILEEVGPANDRRMAVRPAQTDGTPGYAHQFLNFAILDQKLGPSTQPPAHLAICITYYDDPALQGTQIRPEVYATERNGTSTLGFTPTSYFVTLAGSGIWRDAYWEIADMQFRGVNQGPQAAARFVTTDSGDVQAKIPVTRVRYGVIRPCGPLAGVNPLEGCKPVSMEYEKTGTSLKLSWPSVAEGNYVVESTPSLSEPNWTVTNLTVEVVGGRKVVTVPIGTGAQYFRLSK
jgi:hypothetical protein